MYGSNSGKLVPLIICDLNTGTIAMDSMQGYKRDNVFLALQRLQFWFGTQIIQAYTGKGLQMEGATKKQYSRAEKDDKYSFQPNGCDQ